MHNFKDLDIKPKITSFIGDKVPVKKLLNVPIEISEFRIEPSKQKPGTELLTMQIAKSGEKRVVFTGSKVLIDQIKRVPQDKFPFVAVIKADNDYYEFT
jgi:hypothetical protein